MAELTLKIGNTGETIPVYNLELDQVTNAELISQLVASGLVSEQPGKVYRMVGMDNKIVLGEATLASIGFNDGGVATIIFHPA